LVALAAFLCKSEVFQHVVTETVSCCCYRTIQQCKISNEKIIPRNVGIEIVCILDRSGS